MPPKVPRAEAQMVSSPGWDPPLEAPKGSVGQASWPSSSEPVCPIWQLNQPMAFPAHPTVLQEALWLPPPPRSSLLLLSSGHE